MPGPEQAARDQRCGRAYRVMAAPPFAVTVAASDDGITVVVRGEIDASTSARLDDVLTSAIDHAEHVTADLGAVTFIDAGGLRALISADRRLRATGRRLDLADPSPAVTRLLSLVDDQVHFG